MSLELNDIKEDPETSITDLDKLQARMREDHFMIHVLNSLPVKYESVVEYMETDLRIGILTV